MALPDINFENIRAHEGSLNSGFEELCTQLALLETPVQSQFYRKGRGADAGVECYQKNLNGAEIGWQAKYLFNWDSNLESQLNDSIKTALAKHPQLIEYVVCLPFNLSDSRQGRGKSALDKWIAWKEKWIKHALDQGRTLTISFWGKSELISRLSIDNAACGGRILYWFSKESLTHNWFVQQFERSKAALGPRYTPETNIELPIRKRIIALARDAGLQKQLDEWFLQITIEGRSAANAIRNLGAADSAEPHSKAIADQVKILSLLIGANPIQPNESYPLNNWMNAVRKCKVCVTEVLEWVFELQIAKHNDSKDPKRGVENCLYSFISLLNDINEELKSIRWQLANADALLLTGPAGIGKSHLLADIVEFQIHEGRPALLLLGSTFIDSDPWRQILNQLDRPTTEQIKHFLGAIDSAAQAIGVKALFCIDALNERNGIDVWPSRLVAFLKDIEAFPHISVILSCRSTYVPYVIPDELNEKRLLRITHEGFATDGGIAAKAYLDIRGVVRPGAPNLVPEFNNPLFLKTCCDFLEKEGKSELPRSIQGVTSIFEFYTSAVVKVLNKRMKLSPHFEIIERAIDGFARLLKNEGQSYIAKRSALDFFESLLISNADLEKSLLSQLENEGLLTIEPIRNDNGTIVEMVRFTFERFSDYVIAFHILKSHLDKNDALNSFQSGQPLYEFVFGSKNYSRAGIIEAIAVLLPEQANIEVLDVVANEHPWVVRNAFLESLLWREQSHFSDRTLELAHLLLDEKEIHDLLISISTEPLNKFNGRYIHSKLIDMSMQERDASWSIYLAENGYDGSVETLISWAINNSTEYIEDDRAYLAATMLVWFLTTSHRSVRDKATKALTCILANRLTLAVKLISDFNNINDAYVHERLLAACYGAALQGYQTGLKELAFAVYELIFSKGEPPIDALLRDHAKGIIEYAKWRGVINKSIKITKTRPPYKSPWPIEPVPDELIESYTQDYGNGSFRDAIVGSVVNDGDFARYKLNSKLNKWSPAPYGVKQLPSEKDIYNIWLGEFLTNTSAQQLELFIDYLEAAAEAKDVRGYQKTPETEQLATIESQLQKAMGSDQWEAFRVEAKDYIRFHMFNQRSRNNVATFNMAWARRWICKRAHDLGWTTEKFGLFDRLHGSYDRNNHEIERIGKKYQWIAFRELIARMADNLAYIDGSWNSNKVITKYKGASQIGLRDIDPSLLTLETHYDGWKEWDRTWWSPASVHLRPMAPRERLAWLKSEKDILNDNSLFDLKNPKTGQRWLALSGFSRWSAYGISDTEKEYQRETWYRINCLVVHREDENSVIKYLKKEILTNDSKLPKIDLYGDFYLGEYPWHPDPRH